MTVATVKIGICGNGTVGGGVLRLLHDNAQLVAARAGVPLQVLWLGARRDRPGFDTGGVAVSRDLLAVARDPDIDILVEVIGGTDAALELIETALRAGKHVVTANKALIAEHGNALFALAHEQGVCLRFEAAVAGGIPIIKALREGLAGNRVDWLAGIINGTGNFILTEMRDRGRCFADALAEAQVLGYAEADPRYDVEGTDAAHKLAILAGIAFGMPLCLHAVYTEGISRVTPQDVEYAAELGYRIKPLGVARRSAAGVEMRVHPTLIPRERVLANVDGVGNAILVEADRAGPTLYYGAGAGAEPTASAVVADLIDLARDLAAGQINRVPPLGVAADAVQTLPLVPMARVETPWYLRMEAEDRPGVLSKVATIISDQGISIEALIQKAPREFETCVPLVVLTNRAAQERVDVAVRAIEALDSIRGEVVRIRVETLDG